MSSILYFRLGALIGSVASFSAPSSSQQGSVVVSCFFLSATGGPTSCSKLGAIIIIILAQASLSLRNTRCIKFNELRHNKAHKFAPFGSGRSLRSRRFAWRYAASAEYE